MNPEQVLKDGAEILIPIFAKHSYNFSLETEGASSGGLFASGSFQRGDRKLELHVRHSLGMVSYTLGDRRITHEIYMWAMIGKRHASRYPGFSDDPLHSFRSIAADLKEFGGSFLSGTDEEFLRHIEKGARLEAERPRLP